jgi:predicted small lipoprotein YifL
MMRSLIGAVLVFALLIPLGCGKKGPIQLPLARVPQKAESTTLVQRGNKIFLEWKNPGAYTDGSPLTDIAEVEIWLLEEDIPEAGAFPKISRESYKNRAKVSASVKGEDLSPSQKAKSKTLPEFVYVYPLGSGQTAAKRLTFSLRLVDKKGKQSDFSELHTIEPSPLPLSPENLKATVFQDRVELHWEAPPVLAEPPSARTPAGYNIYRAEGEELPRLINTTIVKELIYADKEFEFEKDYRYFVRASINETAPYFESDDSESVEVRPKDTFPPATPSGLLLVRGKDFIALSWAANRERDLAGYKVWRKAQGETEFTLLTPQPIAENSYTDRAIEKGNRYDYAISAADKTGNESPKSEIASEFVKEDKS